MRKLIIAAAVALTASISFGAVAEAAGIAVVIGDHDRDHYRHDHRYWHRDYHHDRREIYRVQHRRHADCVVRKVVSHHHGRRVVEKTRICR